MSGVRREKKDRIRRHFGEGWGRFTKWRLTTWCILRLSRLRTDVAKRECTLADRIWYGLLRTIRDYFEWSAVRSTIRPLPERPPSFGEQRDEQGRQDVRGEMCGMKQDRLTQNKRAR